MKVENLHARMCVEKYIEREHTITKFAPKYLIGGETVNILYSELKLRSTEKMLQSDRKIAFENTATSHDYH